MFALTMLTPAATITVLGLGFAGSALCAQLARQGCAVRAFDLPRQQAASGDALRAHIEALGADPQPSLAAALSGARLVIAAVTPTGSPALAVAVAALMQPGQIYLDLGSHSDLLAAHLALFSTRGCLYVPGRAGPPLQIAGAHAERLAAALAAVGCPAWPVAQLPEPADTPLPPDTILRRLDRRGELP